MTNCGLAYCLVDIREVHRNGEAVDRHRLRCPALVDNGRPFVSNGQHQTAMFQRPIRIPRVM